NGSIAHYNSNVWEKIESGTELPIKDIWGVSSTVSEQNLILAPASKKYNVGEKKLLHINNNSHEVKEMLWPFQNRRIHSVWFRDPRQIWVCGAGIFLYKNSEWNEFTNVPLMFTNRIRGKDINDIFVVGDFGIVTHFNGISWKTFFDFPASLYYSCDYNENIMVAVGGLNPDAIILQATRR
ncbi:MAG: glucosyl transferase, partial [Calditrichia bacterium]|nr:glucosyl transferase [Calditrichia bacterium]